MTREQRTAMADYVLAETKNIENCPFASQEEKDAEMRHSENLMNLLKSHTRI